MKDFLSRMYPPDFEAVPPVSQSIIETIQIAVVGTVLGAIFALPLGLLAARNISPPIAQISSRFILNFIRTIPSIVWALFFVAAVGLGPFPGALAITFYTIGFLGKLYFESIEAIDPGQVEAVTATGANKIQVIWYAVFPQIISLFASYILYIFEYNVRAAAVLGIVGAGGVGFYILMYVRTFQYEKVATVIVLLLVTVTAIDWLSSKVRTRII